MNKTQCKYNNRNYITKPVAKRFAVPLFFLESRVNTTH